MSDTPHLPVRRREALALVLGTGAALAGCASSRPPDDPPAAGTMPGAAATAAKPPRDVPAASSAAFDDWSRAFAADWVRQTPEAATTTQYFEGAEQAAIDRRLTPHTPAQREQQQRLAREGSTALQGFGAETLSPNQRAEAATLRWSLQRTLESSPFQDHGFAFSQTWGLQVRLVSFLGENHPLRDAADVDAYLERLAQVPDRIDEALARSRAAGERGLLPPRFIVERTQAQVEMFLAPAPAQNLFVTALERRSARIAALPAPERQRALDRATELVAGRIRPAWQRIGALLAELHPRTNADAGLWRLPDGAAAYAQALASNTTTTLGADEIHAIGLREVARIEAEMDAVLRTLGLVDGPVSARMSALDASLQPPTLPDPRPALIERYAGYVRDAQRRSQGLFNLQPRAPVEVQRVSPLIEATTSAHYTAPAPDGSRPGIFWAPLPGPVFGIARMRSLAVHEAVPGHHFQLALQQEQPDLPRWRQRRIFGGGSAHSEGWALYAERLALDEGWYEGDAHGQLGALDSQLFRARRLVVDTGLHALRWTREQAIAYGIGAQEVERYVVNPGQACAYMIGMLRILALRDEAERALGARFDLRGFHDVVLKTGSVPLDVLQDVVRAWAGPSGGKAV